MSRQVGTLFSLGSQLQGVEAGCSWGCHMFTWQDREAHMEEGKTETERVRGEKNDGKTEAKVGRESLPGLGPPHQQVPLAVWSWVPHTCRQAPNWCLGLCSPHGAGLGLLPSSGRFQDTRERWEVDPWGLSVPRAPCTACAHSQPSESLPAWLDFAAA